MIELFTGFTFLHVTITAVSVFIAAGFGAAYYADYVLGRCNRKRNTGLIGGMTLVWAGLAIKSGYWSYVFIAQDWKVLTIGTEQFNKIGLVVPLTGMLLVLVGAIMHLQTLALNRGWGRSRLLFGGVGVVCLGVVVAVTS